MANLFPLDLWGYLHGFGYQPESLIAPFVYYDLLKAQNLEALLPTIIVFVTSVLLPEQNTIKKKQVYENSTRVRGRRYLGQYGFCERVRSRPLSGRRSASRV